MANPIMPIGSRRNNSGDIFDNARQQDLERRIREDNEHFRRTGENRPPVQEYSPLVDDDRPDVAYDGDSYDERVTRFQPPDQNAYVENAPSRLINPDDLRTDLMAMHGIDVSREINALRRPVASRNEREAFMQREQVKQDKEFRDKAEKHKGRITNAINGLLLEED